MTYEDVLTYWKGLDIRTVPQLKNALKSTIISFAYNSGKIENDAITFMQTMHVFEDGAVRNCAGSKTTFAEVFGERNAYELALRFAEEKRALGHEEIKALHRAMTEGTYDARRLSKGERPGEYKHHDYVVGPVGAGEAPEFVEECLTDLFDQVSDALEDHSSDASAVFKIAAWFHASFESVHPFADGNGRTGRLAMNYLLVTHGHPLVVIHEEDRFQYYMALEAFRSFDKLDSMIKFLKQQTVKTWGRIVEG